MFISLVLFQFACFALSVEAFKQFTPTLQSMYSGPVVFGVHSVLFAMYIYVCLMNMQDV